MSKTPETDAVAYECRQRSSQGGYTVANKYQRKDGDCVSSDFARKLEVQRDKLLEALEIAEKYLVERGIEHRGVTGRTVVLPAIRAAIAKIKQESK